MSERSVPGAQPDVSAPGPLLLMMEARAPWEYAAMLAATPWLARMPVGDGHPVIVFPGLGASDLTTITLRNFLRSRGYSPQAWKLDACRELVREVASRHREKISFVGWSLGGIYAREMAKEFPQHARCVVTLGTPFTGPARATNAWRFYELVSGQKTDNPALRKQIAVPPQCPTTSIYSKTDGIVAWPCSLNKPSASAENIEVQASHIGMGMNPLALYAVADRLAQDPKTWKPFDVQGARRWFFKTGAPGLGAL
jgi:pimeloyl-ACP methyl ester carboxylesterase